MASNSSKIHSSKKPTRFSPTGLRQKQKKRSQTRSKRDDFKSRFLASLTEKKQELEETIKYLENTQREDLSKDSIDSYIDELDRADKEMSAQNYYKLLDRKKRVLNRIYALIERAQQERDIGICEECGQQIPEERLLIIPEAVLCVSCQRLFEKQESRTNLARTANNHSHWRDDYNLKDTDDIYDDGVIIKPSTDRVSLIDLDEIELEDIPDGQDDNGET